MPRARRLLQLIVSLSLVLNGSGAAFASMQSQQAADPPPCHETVPHSDCCDTGVCVCECMPASPTLVAAAVVQAAVIDHAPSVRALASGHASQVSDPAVRPPID